MWASHAIEQLRRGETAVITPRGNSMRPRVLSGARVTLEPVSPEQLAVEDIVLVRVKGKVYLHLVRAIQGSRFLIGNNRGGINGWVGGRSIYGRAVTIENP